LSDDDADIEREMLEGLERLVALQAMLTPARLPSVETGHRVVGAETCHFSAPASLPDEEGQPSGRLLLTSGRAIVVGGTRPATMKWHLVRQVLRVDRDMILVPADRHQAVRVRCNSFGDALCATVISRRLSEGPRPPL